MEKWDNNSILSFDEGKLRLNEYLGFGAEPKKGIFE